MNQKNDLPTDIRALFENFREHFIERDEEILGAILAILSNENILYLGPPGTAKTYLAQSICKSIADADFFYYLLTRFTTPEEIFGPLSIKSLEQDEFRRKTEGCLPDSHIAFLDEIFKANSSILNSLLTILNERRFHNGTEVIDTPLLTVFGASNELPEEDENLEALYDRFLFRYDVRYIQDEENVSALLFSEKGEFTPSVSISVDQIQAVRIQSLTVTVPQEVREMILSLKKHLEQRDEDEEEGIGISDRRWKKIVGVLRIAAAASGYFSVNRTMLLVLQHMLWNLPDQKEEIRTAIIDHLVTGGIDTGDLETGMKNLHGMLMEGRLFIGDENLPVPVFAHDSEGNHQKIQTYRGLVEASQSTRCFYFTIENSFTTCYQFPQVMTILRSSYGFSPKKFRKSDTRSICESEYADLQTRFHALERNVKAAADSLKDEMDSNIWITPHDRDEISCILHEKISRLDHLEASLNSLKAAIAKQ